MTQALVLLSHNWSVTALLQRTSVGYGGKMPPLQLDMLAAEGNQGGFARIALA